MDVTGKKIVLTGAFDTPRGELAAALAARGAVISGSVSSRTDLLVAGKRAGSKLKKAENLNVPVIGEAELKAILAQPATVEVAPKPKKTVALPEPWGQSSHPWMKGKAFCLTGTLETMKRAELKALIEHNGGKVTSSPSRKTSYMVSGDKWGSKLRDAIAADVSVLSEGELLLMLEGRGLGAFPEPGDIPNAEHLRALPVLEEGEVALSRPAGARKKLVLKWAKVAFTPHRRFRELFGFSFSGDVQYVGRLYYGGQALEPADLYRIYGAESWRRSLFWENGSDFDDHALMFDGEHGFNCTPLVTHRAHRARNLKWKPTGYVGSAVQMAEFDGEGRWFGDVTSSDVSHWLLVDLEAGQFAWNVHTAPYIISPSEPYGH